MKCIDLFLQSQILQVAATLLPTLDFLLTKKIKWSTVCGERKQTNVVYKNLLYWTNRRWELVKKSKAHVIIRLLRLFLLGFFFLLFFCILSRSSTGSSSTSSYSTTSWNGSQFASSSLNDLMGGNKNLLQKTEANETYDLSLQFPKTDTPKKACWSKKNQQGIPSHCCKTLHTRWNTGSPSLYDIFLWNKFYSIKISQSPKTVMKHSSNVWISSLFHVLVLLNCWFSPF